MSRLVDPVLAYLLDDLAELAAFGLETEVVFFTVNAVISGFPVSEDVYFAKLGERFRESAEEVSSILWSREMNKRRVAQKELGRGWQERSLEEMGRAREQSYLRFGEYQHELLRQRVQSRPNRIEWNQSSDEILAERAKSNALFGDTGLADRRFVHLQRVRHLLSSELPVQLTFLRLDLASVVGWSLP